MFPNRPRLTKVGGKCSLGRQAAPASPQAASPSVRAAAAGVNITEKDGGSVAESSNPALSFGGLGFAGYRSVRPVLRRQPCVVRF